MATTVQLQLTLDASGAITGVTQFGNEIKKLSPPSSSVSKGFGDVEDQVKRAQKAIEGLAKITGIDVPSALEEVMAKSKLLGPVLADALGVITGGEIGLALVQIGQQAYEAFGRISDQMMGLTDKVKKNNEELSKDNMERYLHPGSIAQTNKNLQEVVGTTQRLRDKQEEYAKATEEVVDYTGETMSGLEAAAIIRSQSVISLEKEQELQKNSGVLQENSVALAKELHQAQVQGNEAGLKGLALIEQQHKDNKQLVEDEIALRSFKQGNFKDSEIAKAMEASVDAQYRAQKREFERQSADQTMALRHQVMEDAVQGTAKIRQIESDAIEDVNRKEREGAITHKDAVAQRVLIHQRAAQDIVRAQEQMAEETQAMQDQARDASLQGDDLIYAHQEELVDKQRNLYAKGLIDWDNYQERISAIDEITQQALRKRAEETARKKADLLGQQIDAERATALASIPEWQRANVQIEFDYEKRVRDINQQEQDLLKQYKGDQDIIVQITQTAQARREAAWAEKNDRIRQEHKRLVEQLGSDLESVFDDISSGNIGKRILNNIKKFFFQIVAAWLDATGFMRTIWGKIFGTLFGGPGSSLEQSSGGGIGPLIGLFSGQSAAVPTTAGSAAAATTAAGSLLAPSGAGGFTASSAVTGSANTGLGGTSIGQGIANLFGGGSNATGGLSLKAGATFKSLFSAQNIVSLGTLGLSLGAGLVGGKPGQVGGMLSALSLMAQANPSGPAAMLLSHFGLMSGLAGTIFASLGPALIGFGIGTHFGPLGGALAGGGAGFGVGALIGLAGGPIGALIGGIVGAIAGLFGGLFGSGKRKRQANAFANTQVLPAVSQIEDQYKNFSLDYSSAIGQLEELRKQAQDNLSKLKGEGRDVMKKVVGPAIDHAEADINGFEAERQRRAALTFGPPEFHSGGFVDSMTRSFTSRPGDLLAVLKRGEFVVNPAATAKNRRTLEAINSGGSAALSVGEIHIHPTTLDRAYVRSGFKQDLLDALNSLRKEGRL